MTYSYFRLCTIRGLAVFLCAAAASATGADLLTRISDGSLIRGKLETLSKTKIEIRRSNDEVESISPDDLQDIRFDREPPVLQTARSNERSGAYAAAIGQLREVQSGYSGGDRRVVEEIEFLIARCQARQALLDPSVAETALESLQAFIQSYGNSYRALETILLQAQLLVVTDRPRAVGLLQQLRDSGVAGFAMRAGVVLGNALLNNNEPDQALQVFEDVIRKSQDKATALTANLESRIGLARCLQQQDRLQDALKALDAVIADAPDDKPTTLAQAWIHAGNCHQDDENPRAALLAYLHVDLLYPEATKEHAESLHQLAPLWEAAGHPGRARDARSRLRNQYPDSKWAEEPQN